MASGKKFIIGGLILLLILTFLGYRAFSESVPYYFTVSELLSHGNAIRLENVRVNGVVSTGTVEQETDTLDTTFTLTDGEKKLQVSYHGILPQTFEEGKEIIIEGKYNPNGTFEASAILTKCPSKYTTPEQK